MNKTKWYTERVLLLWKCTLSKCDLTCFSTNIRFEDFYWMLPRSTEKTVAGHMRPAGL